jgi:hypothetical protein
MNLDGAPVIIRVWFILDHINIASSGNSYNLNNNFSTGTTISATIGFKNPQTVLRLMDSW